MSVSPEECRLEYIVPNNIETKIAVDIGGNIGGFSIAYQKTFDEIYLFEANKSTFNKMVENTKNFKNITSYNLAVLDRSDLEIVLMNHSSKDDGSVSCSPTITNGNPDWSEVIGTVKTISIEGILNLIGNRRINFLKIDCENSEYEILLNKDLSMIDYISMEIHWQMGIEKYEELINYLSKFFNIKGRTKFVKGSNTILNLEKL